jgi:hypothetical protein
MKTNIIKLIGISLLFFTCQISTAQNHIAGISSSGGSLDPCHPPVCYPFQNLDLLQIYATDLQILEALSQSSTCCTRQGTQDSILTTLKSINTIIENFDSVTTNNFSYTYIKGSGVHTYTYGSYWAISVQNIGTVNAQFDGNTLPPGAIVTIGYSRYRLPKTVTLNALSSTLIVLVQ